MSNAEIIRLVKAQERDQAKTGGRGTWKNLSAEQAEARKARMRAGREAAIAKRLCMNLDEYLKLPQRPNGRRIFPKKKTKPAQPQPCPPETAGRIVLALLQDYYDPEKRRYLDSWTDQKVAEALNVPRAWVSAERQKFGDDKNEQPAFVEQLTSELKALGEQQLAFFDAAVRDIAELTKKIEASSAEFETKRLGLEKRLKEALR